MIVSPDAGRVKVARNFARKVGVHWAVMEKERPAQQVAEIGYVVGDVHGKTAVLVDDMIDTAGTLTAAAQTVLDEGAARVIACATHGVFSGPAYERLAYENSGDRADRRHRHDPAAPRRAGQHHRALGRADARRLDPPHLRRRLGLGDLRGREPALLSTDSVLPALRSQPGSRDAPLAVDLDHQHGARLRRPCRRRGSDPRPGPGCR